MDTLGKMVLLRRPEDYPAGQLRNSYSLRNRRVASVALQLVNLVLDMPTYGYVGTPQSNNPPGPAWRSSVARFKVSP